MLVVARAVAVATRGWVAGEGGVLATVAMVVTMDDGGGDNDGGRAGGKGGDRGGILVVWAAQVVQIRLSAILHALALCESALRARVPSPRSLLSRACLVSGGPGRVRRVCYYVVPTRLLLL